MSAAEEMAKQEDRMAGRVIPRWKYEVALWGGMVGVMGARLLPDGIWWTLLCGLVVAYSLSFTLSDYKQRAFR